MKIRLIYPTWKKLVEQREFHLPPHGPVVFAATVPEEHDLSFTDENVSAIDFDEDVDFVCISVMLTAQVKRSWEIAEKFRARGIPVIAGGIATSLHADEMMEHMDAVFVGEAEGRFAQVLSDLAAGELAPRYDYHGVFPSIDEVGPARRSLLDRSLYNYRGVQMPALMHASRGCRFNCYPCCVPYLGGRNFRPRPIDQVVAEIAALPERRVFLVDNSMAQNKEWELELFRALKPLDRDFITHPIEDDDEVLDVAVEGGLWWVYQAVFDTSDFIRKRVRRLKERGIKVEGTILLGLDRHSEDDIKRIIDFLLEIDLDLAEFTVLTPFPHSKTFDEYDRAGRILHRDWEKYTAGEVVIQPAQMSPERLQELYDYAWESFYADESQEEKMAHVLRKSLLAERKGRRIARSQQRSWG